MSWTYSKEASNKVARQLRLWILLNLEVLEHVCQLLPVVECFLSCCSLALTSHSDTSTEEGQSMYLELAMTLEDQNVHRWQLLHISMPFELLPYLCADRRDGEVERVHLLDFWRLYPFTSAFFLLSLPPLLDPLRL